MTVAAVAASVLPFAAAACTSDSGTGEADVPSKHGQPKPATGDKTADCGKGSELSQADWTELCGDDAGMQDPSKPLRAGESFTFPDKLAVTVVRAEKVAASEAEPGETPFRLHIKFTNKGKAPVKLDDFSLFVEGATNGGEAATTVFDSSDDAAEIGGRLAPGVTATKTEDWVLDKKYGNKIVVSLQYGNDGADTYPEANVTIR
ncbi:hypothetical protein [Streptomyces axinellae]|uniref:DUF4352 domain-containing protein n=1 Tax=Streptomyces axinellae TaxID=552788 RepID=A0ABN3QLW0_9ACTN